MPPSGKPFHLTNEEAEVQEAKWPGRRDKKWTWIGYSQSWPSSPTSRKPSQATILAELWGQYYASRVLRLQGNPPDKDAVLSGEQALDTGLCRSAACLPQALREGSPCFSLIWPGNHYGGKDGGKGKPGHPCGKVVDLGKGKCRGWKYSYYFLTLGFIRKKTKWLAVPWWVKTINFLSLLTLPWQWNSRQLGWSQ